MIEKQKLEAIGAEFLPPPVFRAFVNVRARLLFNLFREKKILGSNKQWKNTAKGKRAFVLATGPSLKQENIKPLAGEDCFSISNFFLHDDLLLIRPKFHFFAPYHKPLVLENYIDWLRIADNTLPAETYIVLGHTTLPIVKQHNLFSERKVFYLFLEGKFSGDFNIQRSVMGPQTGPIMILPWLLYMGYSKIYLLGCDHTIFRNYGKTTKNFYASDKDARRNATNGDNWPDIMTLLKFTERTFRQYSYYKKTADRLGVEIINLSQDSWLDMFKKEKLEDVVS